MKRAVKAVQVFLSVSTAGGVAGTGIGVLTALIAFRGDKTPWWFAPDGAAVGLVCSLPLTWIAYYRIFKQQLTFLEASFVIAVTAIVSTGSAVVLLEAGGLGSMLLGVIAFFVMCSEVRNRSRLGQP